MLSFVSNSIKESAWDNITYMFSKDYMQYMFVPGKAVQPLLIAMR
jgi:hypothetical protein